MLFARLEQETRPFHEAVERPWLALMSPQVTRGQYIAQLGRAYGFEVPLESALAHTPRFTLLFGTRSRSRLLSRDLFALDFQGLSSLPRRPLQAFGDVAQAAGWLYVLERTTQLYPMIANHVLSHFPQLGNACTYLSDLAAQHRWAALEPAFEAIACTPQVQMQIVEAAKDAYAAVAAWYAPKNEALRAGA